MVYRCYCCSCILTAATSPITTSPTTINTCSSGSSRRLFVLIVRMKTCIVEATLLLSMMIHVSAIGCCYAGCYYHCS